MDPRTIKFDSCNGRGELIGLRRMPLDVFHPFSCWRLDEFGRAVIVVWCSA